MVTPVARRSPFKLARETASLDRLSDGRLVFGAGLGDRPDLELATFGAEPDPRIRAEQLDEGLEILSRLWRGEETTFTGRHFEVRGAAFLPRPVQEPRIPIWIGGHWPHLGRSDARHAGMACSRSETTPSLRRTTGSPRRWWPLNAVIPQAGTSSTPSDPPAARPTGRSMLGS